MAIPKISVIMSTYNPGSCPYLREAVLSVLNQTYTDFEFIICDDGSGEEALALLRELASKDSRIRLIKNEGNGGLAHGLNRCIAEAAGKYLARMDDDDICLPERLQIQYEYLEKHPETDFVGCNARLIDREGDWGCRKMPEQPEKKDFLRFSPYIHPAVMLRRSVFDGREAYRTDTVRGEDYELFMRLTEQGFRGCNIQQELFCYRENQDSYKKRKLGSRLDEVKIRGRGFARLGILLPVGWLYVLRPLAAGCIPPGLLYKVRKVHHRRDGELEYEKIQLENDDGRHGNLYADGVFLSRSTGPVPSAGGNGAAKIYFD